MYASTSIEPATPHLQYWCPRCHGRFMLFSRICDYIYCHSLEIGIKMNASHKHRTSESTHAVLVPQISWMLHVIETYLWLHIWTLLYFDLKLVYQNIRKPWGSNQHIGLWTLYIILVVFVSMWRLHLEGYNLFLSLFGRKKPEKNGEGFALLHNTAFLLIKKNNIIFIYY